MTREKRIYLAYESTKKRLTREGNTQPHLVALIRVSKLFGLSTADVYQIALEFRKSLNK